MIMEESLAKELEEVDCQLVCVQDELETLLERQQELQERRQLLKVQLDSIENVRLQEEKTFLEATDWEHGEFPWSEKVNSILRSFFKLESFRHLQLSCINASLSNKDAVLIMPTGRRKITSQDSNPGLLIASQMLLLWRILLHAQHEQLLAGFLGEKPIQHQPNAAYIGTRIICTAEKLL